MTLLGVNDGCAGLVGAALGGDRQAFGRLVESHWAGLVRLARSVVGDIEAEDAVQDALIVAWRKLPTLAEVAAFTPWLTRIVVRRCLRRVRFRRRLVPLEAAPQGSHNPDAAGLLAARQVLGRLAPRQRAVLHLTVVEGMSDGEIGAALGIAASSVRAHRRRAREAVARILNGGKP